MHQRIIERVRLAGEVLGICLGDAERGIEIDTVVRHFGEHRIGDLVAPGAVLDGTRAGVHGVGDVARIAGVDRQREILRVRFRGHRLEDRYIHAVEQHPLSPSRFQDRLDAIHAALLQFVDLLARLAGGLRHAHQLSLDLVLHRLGHVLRVFGAMAAFDGEHRTANEELRSQLAAGGDLAAQFDGGVQAVAGTARRGHAAIE